MPKTLVDEHVNKPKAPFWAGGFYTPKQELEMGKRLMRGLRGWEVTRGLRLPVERPSPYELSKDPRRALKKPGLFKGCDPAIADFVRLAHGVGASAPLTDVDFYIFNAARRGNKAEVVKLARRALSDIGAGHEKREVALAKKEVYERLARKPGQLLTVVAKLGPLFKPGNGYYYVTGNFVKSAP